MMDSMPTLIHLEHFSLSASTGSAAGIPLTGDDLDRHFKNQCGQNRSELQKEVEAIVTNPIALKYMSGAQRDIALNRAPSSSSSYPRNSTTTSDTDQERISMQAPSSSFPTSSGASRTNLNSASVLSMQTLSKRKEKMAKKESNPS